MRNLFLVPLLIIPFASVQAAPADLPETGQTTCSDSSGATIDCANTGQDGEYRSGAAWPNPRFTRGSGTTADCITDNLTGLMWMRAPDSLGVGNWATALSTSNDLSLCGFSDWRLPNVRELESLIHNGVENGVTYLRNEGFSILDANYYWTSTSDPNPGFRSSRNVWVINLLTGLMHATGNTSTGYTFWPVRAGR